MAEYEIREMTDAAIRESFLYAQLHLRGHDTNEFATGVTVALNGAFDRWLAAHDREVAERAFDEGVHAPHSSMNPYRVDGQETGQ